MMGRSVMLRALMAVVLLVSSNVGMAQSDRDLMNDAIELIQRLMADNELIFERLRALENAQDGGCAQSAPAGGGQVSGTFQISDPSEQSKRLARHTFCGLSVVGEECECAVEYQSSGEFVL